MPFCDAVAHALPWGVIGAFVAATIVPEKGVHLHSHGKRTGVGHHGVHCAARVNRIAQVLRSEL
jgi:hypothetical protein